jgi:diguanylate cyclase (GGDEF)-like protein
MMPFDLCLSANGLPIPSDEDNSLPARAPAEWREDDLAEIIERRLLHPVFQPILGFRARCYLGFEALIRGPQGSPLHMPQALFGAAHRLGLVLELERACRELSLRAFAATGLAGKLFLNVSPQCLRDPSLLNGGTLRLLRDLGVPPSRVVLEITENQKITDFAEVRDLLAHYRGLGHDIAIDDLGEGFSNLRMWTELHPQYVKIDRHFINGIGDDALKFQMVRSIHGLAEACSAHIIAEGIETEAEFRTVRDLGIAYGQGFFIARPQQHPADGPGSAVSGALARRHISVFPGIQAPPSNGTARALLMHVEPVGPEVDNDCVYQRFELDPEENVIPVVANGVPIGLINRISMIDRFARPFRRELFGRRPCEQIMDVDPIVVEHDTSVQEISRQISSTARHRIHDGFVITENGHYIGIGSTQDLMALITELQMKAARYANPLTQLPGNVPIDEHIDRLLENEIPFAAAYCDLDRFKPFNDVYGYRMGDDLIRILAHSLAEAADPALDFIGHIGGDDFIVLFQSEDWNMRCDRIIRSFDEQAKTLYTPEDQARGGILAEDRLGRSHFHALPTLSIGVVPVEAGIFASHHEISAAAAEAKKQAKREPGSFIFVERRRGAVRGNIASG